MPFRVGETLEYDVSWSTYLTAGTATLKVQQKKPSFGSTAYYIFAEGRPTPLVSKLYSLYYKADTLLDVFTLLPQRGSVYSEENGHRRMKITRFDQAARKAEYEIQTATVVKTGFALAPYTQDVLSAIYVLRAIPLREGGRLSMPVADNGAAYSIRVTVGAREPVRTGIGTVPAWKIVPVITDGQGRQIGRGLAVWISDDVRRLPVKLEAEIAVGRFVLVLREVKP
ncbi:MAG: DUF3108 domain-containing protein [Acidobacteria bacterium]|nr:DUF3108 domain-containing protein [Acidobacteriota bacterium]